MKALLDPSVKKIAIANPQHAPYGQAAVAAMQRENIYDKIKDKFVLGENHFSNRIVRGFGRGGCGHRGTVACRIAEHERERPLHRSPCGRISAD